MEEPLLQKDTELDDGPSSTHEEDESKKPPHKEEGAKKPSPPPGQPPPSQAENERTKKAAENERTNKAAENERTNKVWPNGQPPPGQAENERTKKAAENERTKKARPKKTSPPSVEKDAPPTLSETAPVTMTRTPAPVTNDKNPALSETGAPGGSRGGWDKNPALSETGAPGGSRGGWDKNPALSEAGAPGGSRGGWRTKWRLLEATREPRLPVYYTEAEKQLVDKREVLYALALATPVAILTAAAGLKVFDGGWASVAGASVGVSVLAASGMVLNQYAVFDWERLAARHLGRLGILGAAVLFCFFTYRAFFPSASWAIWCLLTITAVVLGLPWIMSCVRGDDDVTLTSVKSDGDAAERAGKEEMRQGEPARRRSI